MEITIYNSSVSFKNLNFMGKLIVVLMVGTMIIQILEMIKMQKFDFFMPDAIVLRVLIIYLVLVSDWGKKRTTMTKKEAIDFIECQESIKVKK